MSKVTIYVPEALRDAMRAKPDVNWSALAQKAWARRLGLTLIPATPAKIRRRNTA